LLENLQGSSTQILTHHIPSVLQLNILETTHINISAKHDGELILYNQIVPADTSLEFMFDTSVNFDLLNAKHIQGNLNETILDDHFTKDNVILRGSYIVNSAQLYVAYYSSNNNQSLIEGNP
jgi:hypothetical protein